MKTARRTLNWIALVAAIALVGCAHSSDGGGYYPTGNQSNSNSGGGNIGTSGAQDIGQFRSILDQGGIPGENTLDANGFFSEHHTQLPAPECGEAVCVHGMLAVGRDWIRGEYQATLQVAMSSPVDPASLERKPLNLVVVVDTSGSMSGSAKLEYVKDGLHLLVDNLEDEDRIALVRYASDVDVLWGLHENISAEAMHQTIDGLYPDGATNFYNGLETGLNLARQSLNPDRQNRVIMLSDGMPTVGINDDESIIQMAEGYLELGVGLTTIGVGFDFNVELMRGLAERGAGNFYFLEDTSAITEVFTEELNYFVTPIAYDLQVEVHTGAAYTLGEVVGTKLWSTDNFGGRIDIPAVFLASRTGHDDPPAGEGGRRGGGSAILINLIPSEAWEECSDSSRVARIRLTYRTADATEPRMVEQEIIVQNPNDPGVVGELPYYTHSAIEKNSAMYNVFLGLREATRLAVTSHNHALWVIEQLEEQASSWNSEVQDEDIEADLLLIDQFMENLQEMGARPIDPDDPDSYDPYDPYDPYNPQNDPCYYGGCVEEDDSYFFGCSAAGAGDAAPSALVFVLLVLATLYRRRRPGQRA